MKFDFDKFDAAYNADVKKRISEREKRVAKVQKRKEFGQSLLIVLMILACVGVLINIITGYIQIDQMKYENNILARQVETLDKEIAEIRILIDEKTQSGLIEQIAVKQLGLEHPKSSQVRVLKMGVKYALKDQPGGDTIKSEVALTTAN